MTAKTILLVEDNPTDEALTKRAFARSGVTSDLFVVRDGVEALDYLFARGAFASRNVRDVPAVVLLDLNLPRIDGIEVLKQVRANPITCFLPVVVLTASKQQEDIVRSYTLGANAYVRKPVDFLEFVEAAHTLGVFWLQRNEPPPRSS